MFVYKAFKIFIIKINKVKKIDFTKLKKLHSIIWLNLQASVFILIIVSAKKRILFCEPKTDV